jgi:hypothetical protein
MDRVNKYEQNLNDYWKSHSYPRTSDIREAKRRARQIREKEGK